MLYIVFMIAMEWICVNKKLSNLNNVLYTYIYPIVHSRHFWSLVMEAIESSYQPSLVLLGYVIMRSGRMFTV